MNSFAPKFYFGPYETVTGIKLLLPFLTSILDKTLFFEQSALGSPMYNCFVSWKTRFHFMTSLKAWLVVFEPGRDTKSTFCESLFSHDAFNLCPICSSMAALIWASKVKTLGDIPIFDSKTNGIRLVKRA